MSADTRFGAEFAAQLASIDHDLELRDRRADAGMAQCSRALVRAQLKAGQHVLPFGQAMVAAIAAGLAAHLVRPGIGDPAAFKLREAR